MPGNFTDVVGVGLDQVLLQKVRNLKKENGNDLELYFLMMLKKGFWGHIFEPGMTVAVKKEDMKNTLTFSMQQNQNQSPSKCLEKVLFVDT